MCFNASQNKILIECIEKMHSEEFDPIPRSLYIGFIENYNSFTPEFKSFVKNIIFSETALESAKLFARSILKQPELCTRENLEFLSHAIPENNLVKMEVLCALNYFEDFYPAQNSGVNNSKSNTL
jgi:hypothetical protein